MKKKPTILLIEDNRDDQRFVKLALEYLEIDANLEVVDDARHGMRYLMNEGEYEHAETPDLIIMDINMPRVSGIEMLDLMHVDERIGLIPVIMLTTSDASEDVNACYAKGCNAFVTKPFGHKELLDKLNKLCAFWLDAAELPTVSRPHAKAMA
ncbi:MAG: response regulator [Planctomycetota bacterium]